MKEKIIDIIKKNIHYNSFENDYDEIANSIIELIYKRSIDGAIIRKIQMKNKNGTNLYYYSNKGMISLLYPCERTKNYFETNCVDGDLFEDCEKFDNIEQAEISINQLLM